MYYHCRPLKYVKYGEVLPPPIESYNDDWLLPAYKWVGHYCKYCPQIWLSRSKSSITGYSLKHNKESVLFGFDIIKGFPISYDHWETILNNLINNKTFSKQNESIEKTFNEIIEECKEYDEELDKVFLDWISAGSNLKVFLEKYLFVEKDQVIVPSLNLKSAKKIICHDEKQKKVLRKLGFIEDRIIIKNVKSCRF